MGKKTRPALEIEHVPIDSLHPDPANPLLISDAELEALPRPGEEPARQSRRRALRLSRGDMRMQAVLEGLGGHWWGTIIWAKDRFLLGQADYHSQGGQGRRGNDRLRRVQAGVPGLREAAKHMREARGSVEAQAGGRA